jgi:hypothetical protein
MCQTRTKPGRCSPPASLPPDPMGVPRTTGFGFYLHCKRAGRDNLDGLDNLGVLAEVRT